MAWQQHGRNQVEQPVWNIQPLYQKTRLPDMFWLAIQIMLDIQLFMWYKLCLVLMYCNVIRLCIKMLDYSNHLILLEIWYN